MIAASEFIPNLAAVTGFSEATVRGVYRRLNEAGFLPVSHGATVKKLNCQHVTMLLLALLADAPIKDAAISARAYYALEDKDGNKIGDVLENALNSFRFINDVAPLFIKSRIEVDCGTPRVCIVNNCTDGSTETLYGIRDKIWSDVRVRRSIAIGGNVLFDIAMGVHFNRWNKKETA